jgi:hypothetical protein
LVASVTAATLGAEFRVKHSPFGALFAYPSVAELAPILMLKLENAESNAAEGAVFVELPSVSIGR